MPGVPVVSDHVWIRRAAYAAAVLADNPVGYWHLDETSGAVATDSSTTANNGAYFASPTLGAAPLITSGKAVTFNGTTQFVRVPTNAAYNANNRCTIECWVKTLALNSALVMADDTVGNRFFQLKVAGAGEILVTFYDTVAGLHTYDSGAVINDGVRRQVVAQYDGATVRVFVNGSEFGVGTAGAFTLATANPGIQFAERLSGGSDTLLLAGTLDEISIYTSALSPARILAHYNAGIS